MGIVFITAKPDFMPDPSELGAWLPIQGITGFYTQSLGDYHIIIHECLREVETRWKQQKKHATVASWLKTALDYAHKQWGSFSKDDLYVILHDKDLLHSGDTDEGIYRESNVAEVKGGLEGIVKDGNIYIFQHVIAQDMCVALINELSEPSLDNIKQAISVIKNCTYEA